MTVQAKAHAKNYAPSSAKRWLSCPKSAFITPMYPNDDTDASNKGDYEHDLMEATILFGVVPPSADPEVEEYMAFLLDAVKQEMARMGPSARLGIEERLDTPITGEFGSLDIRITSDTEHHIIDYKSGWVPVEVEMNAQMMTYLISVIEKYGERKRYKISVHQPRYDHRDGPFRTYEVTATDIDWFIGEVRYAVNNPNEIKGGKHCKSTYCPHRGTCAPFHEYIKTDAALGWFSSEVNSITDEELTAALDHAETVAGYRNELRTEALRRIMNMNKHVPGFKVVKGRKDRKIRAEDLIAEKMIEMGAKEADIYSKSFITAKGVEDFAKQYAKVHNLGRGSWKQVYDNNFKEYIVETQAGLTLEREIDGRPAHKRGSEFTPLISPTSDTSINII